MPRREIAVAVIVVLLALVACLAWALYEEAPPPPPSFEESAAKLRAAGLPATIEELDIDRPPPEENAATPFLEAAKLLPAEGEDPLFDFLADPWRQIDVEGLRAADEAADVSRAALTRLFAAERRAEAADAATLLNQLSDEQNGFRHNVKLASPADLNDLTPSAMRALLREAASAVVEPVEALPDLRSSQRSLNADFGVDYAAGEFGIVDLSPLDPARRLSRALVVSALDVGARDDAKGMLRCLHRGWSLADAYTGATNTIIEYQVVAMEESRLLEAAAMLWSEPRMLADAPAREAASALANRWAEEAAVIESRLRSLRGEALLQQSSLSDLQNALDRGEEPDTFTDGEFHPQKDADIAAHLMPEIIAAADAPSLPAALEVAPDRHEIEQRVTDGGGRALLYMSGFLGESGHIIHYSRLAERRLGRLAIAAAFYRADHDEGGGGQLPPTLNALVPDYLDAIPIDPLSGGAFTYDRAAGTITAAYPPDERFATMTPPSVRLRP